jgi:hypothetical protein
MVKPATDTTWEDEAEFRRRYPAFQLVELFPMDGRDIMVGIGLTSEAQGRQMY